MLIIDKPGRSKKDLLKALENIKTSFAAEIQKYDLKVTPFTDGYNLKGEKKIIFINVMADINIRAEDGKYVIDYQTKNIPQSKIDEVLVQVKDVLNKA